MTCCNLDNLLTFETQKVVRVRDRTLGILNYLSMLLIFIYIGVKVFYLDAGYNAHDTPIGSVRVTLKMPTAGVDIHKDDYCSQSPNHNWPAEFAAEQNLPCIVLDEHSVRYPLDELNSIFIATRIAKTKQEYVCGDEHQDPEKNVCVTPYKDVTSATYFLAGIRDYTVGIQHSFYAPLFTSSDEKNSEYYSGSSLAARGALIKDKDTIVKEFEPSSDGTPDILTIGQLMEAANIDIRAQSPDPSNSLLYSGVLTLVMVSYKNKNNEKPTYTYRAKSISSTDYKVYNVQKGIDHMERTILKYGGPKFVFIVTGDIVRFDFQTSLLQLVSALGLFTIAVIVIEFIMIYLLPNRKKYYESKYMIADTIPDDDHDDREEILLDGPRYV